MYLKAVIMTWNRVSWRRWVKKERYWNSLYTCRQHFTWITDLHIVLENILITASRIYRLPLSLFNFSSESVGVVQLPHGDPVGAGRDSVAAVPAVSGLGGSVGGRLRDGRRDAEAVVVKLHLLNLMELRKMGKTSIAKVWMYRGLLYSAQNMVKRDPGRARQNSLATAGTNLTKPGAHNKGDLCTSST